MVPPRETAQKPVRSRRGQQGLERTPPLFLKSTRLRSDPMGEFTWVTGGRAYVRGAEGNNQPQFGLWYSPTRPLTGRRG